ncbi:MAG: MBL fold metallo-hydrolase [Solirubrobacteraceae bacterium]
MSSVDESWFVTREALPGVWMLNEPLHVCTWLVAGAERAILLDSGMGIAPIRSLAERLAGLPVELVTSHYHFDHVGGHSEFEEIAIHGAGAGPLSAGPSPQALGAYAQFIAGRDRHAAAYLTLDRDWFGLATVDTVARPLPAGFKFHTWSIAPATGTRLLREGDRLDLGRRTLTVLHTPGHSPDSISLLDEREGILFPADQFNLGPVLAHFPDSDIEQHACSARRLADLAGDVVRLVCSHHYPLVVGEPRLLREYADLAELVAAHEVELHEATDIVGNHMRYAHFDRFAITVAHPAHPAASLHNPIS